MWIRVAAGIGALAILGQAKPVPIERILAGYSLEKSGRVALHDTLSGCYLVRTGE